MQAYLELLRDELQDAYKRLETAKPEAIQVIKRQIPQIKRDIARNQAQMKAIL